MMAMGSRMVIIPSSLLSDPFDNQSTLIWHAFHRSNNETNKVKFKLNDSSQHNCEK
jgi:hypothetical protein